jgi:hypothetical protein
MEMRSVAWGFLREAAKIPCGRLGAACFIYLLELFYFREGHISLVGWFIPGRISSHQIAVRSVAEGSHLLELHSCGGVFRSELTVGSWSRFSGSGSLHEGRTILGRILWIWACISSLLELLLYQVLSCIVFTVTLHLLSSYIHIDLKLVFPGGVLSRVMLTKNTCVYKCMILVLRSVHNQQ